MTDRATAVRVGWRDPRAGYGWCSIALHWITGLIVLTLLFVGDSIGTGGGGALALHTAIAVTLYPLLVFRLGWRIFAGHPKASPRQRPRGFALGKQVHYALLAMMAVLLASGPPMAWSAGYELRLFGRLLLPNPIGIHPALHAQLLAVHATAAAGLALLVALHIGAVFKHVIVNRDETLERMMVPGRDDGVPDRAQA